MSDNKNKLWTVICGNIRDELDFKLTLTRLIELRSLGKLEHIVFSTWNGEIDKYEGLRRQLKELQVYILEGESFTPEIEKTPSNSVNYWRQARQLLSALDIIPKNDFVLRVRTDRSLNYINYMDKHGIFENYKIKVNQFGHFPKVLDYKVSVFRPRTVRLFQMTDFVLLGKNKDLYKLINFDFYDLDIQKPVVANIQWYAYPFLKEFPVLRDYLRFTRYTQTVPMLKGYVEKYQEKSIFPEVYYKVYAIYFLALYSHFNILSPEKVNQEEREKTGFHHFFSTGPSKGVKYQSLGAIIFDQELLRMAIQGELLKTKAYYKFLGYVKRAVENQDDDDIFELSNTDYREILDFFDNNKFDVALDLMWLKKIRRYPVDKNNLYKYKKLKNENILKCLNVSESEWKKLSYTESIEGDLYKSWLRLKTVNMETTEKMLLPTARTGNECAIYILLDMLYRKLVLDINYNEIIRISLFYMNVRLGSKNPTNITVSIALILIKLYDQKKIELKNINTVISVVLAKMLDFEEVEILLGQKQGSYTEKIIQILNCHHNRFQNDLSDIQFSQAIKNDDMEKVKDYGSFDSIMLLEQLWLSIAGEDVKLSEEIKNKLKGSESIIANKKWLIEEKII